ncbi:MAG: ECF transporter S component [Mogibacterium sp.]|nr:ECF transporter S component [Mogibacterium sp.]MBR2540754.1 ECF transporter S component [Mogibacterium sp.]
MNTSKFSTAMIAKLAMMTAVSLVLLLIIRIPFPPAPFLVYDPADVPIYITAFAYGPVAGLIVTLIVCLIQAFMLGGDGLYGFLMHFVATGIVAVVIGTMYARSKTRKRALISLVVGVIVAVVVMCFMNILVTPAYMGAPREAVVAMIPTVIIPFNLIKAGLNALLTCILYKRVSGFLHRDAAAVVHNEG